MQSPGLIRAIGFGGLVLLCINAVVGSGIYLLPSETWKILGPFSLWAPALFAIPVFVIVVCFAEAASHFSQPGGPYLYARTAFGDFVGFETGWMNILARVTSLAALSNGFVVSLARVWAPASATPVRAALIVGSLALFALIHSLGIRFGARTIYLFTWGKLLPLLIFIVAALFVFRTNPIPAALKIPSAGADWNGAALLLVFAFGGFENLAIPAGEFRNPRRDLPRALLVAILAIAAIYSLTQFAALSALPDLSHTNTPIADAAAAVLGSAGQRLITVGAIVSILGTNLGTILESSRMLYSITEGRARVRALSAIHTRSHAPVIAIWIIATVAAIAALAGSFASLAALSAVARLTTFFFTCAAVPRLRRLDDGFRAPGGLFFPIAGALIAIALFARLKSPQLIAALAALAVGSAFYLIVRWPSREEVPLSAE